MIFLAFPYRRPLPKGQWAVAYVCTTNYHKLILMQATAERAMGGGFRWNSDSELKLKNRCTGSTLTKLQVIVFLWDRIITLYFYCCLGVYSAHSTLLTTCITIVTIRTPVTPITLETISAMTSGGRPHWFTRRAVQTDSKFFRHICHKLKD